jgi:sigma-B regulation protein RsbU (phosphoserine phosphatase)
MQILIAEDDPVSRVLLQRHLEKWGHTVVSAENGDQAWELFRNGDFSMVVSDWMMPGIDGLELTRRIRSEPRPGYVYIIMLTAKSQKEDIVQGMEAGADDFITKPFDRDELRVRLRAGERIVELEHDVLERERKERAAAASIQKGFLPKQRPHTRGLDIFDYYSPAEEIGGDYFDYIPLSGNRLAITLGDVTGKGIPAALLMARLSAAARFWLASRPELSDAVNELNSALLDASSDDHFVTFVVIVLDLNRWTMTIVNCGHMPPLLRRAGGGAPVGLAEEIIDLPLAVMDRPYHQAVVPLGVGETIVLYTDGITEARNHLRELFGIERLTECVRNDGTTAEELGRKILSCVREFAGGHPQDDDITLVCLRRT